MKKIVFTAIGSLAVMAVAGVIAFRTIAAKEEAGTGTQASPKAAKTLQQKIDAIRDAEKNPKHNKGSVRTEVSEAELESYLLYSLKEDIPAKVDTANVQLGPDTVGLDTQITFSQNPTGNSVLDTLVGGTHNLYLKGKLVAQKGRGRFDLQDVRVDGIPVPSLLIQTLIKKYVQPKYPEVDLNKPFDMPWGIQELKVEQGKAIVIY
jgi:hypothetical protein